jgi:hypothetical protein
VLSNEQQRSSYNAKLEEGLKDEEDDFNGERCQKHWPFARMQRAGLMQVLYSSYHMHT